MRVAVITIAAGRHDHLIVQQAGLQDSTRTPDSYIVVAMGDPDLRLALSPALTPAVVDLPVTAGRLPLAAARNAGAAAAIAAGAELLVFLDVDCVPGADLIAHYAFAAQLPSCSNGVLAGPVAYLPAAAKEQDPARWYELAEPHLARPAPAAGEIVAGDDPNLFWSLSFAVTAQTWRRIGGFCEEYEGYGGEDTDFMYLALYAGAQLWWVGGAVAFHQHHESQTPPIDHLDDILRNGAIFQRRWGFWPMVGWLRAFEDLGLVTRDAAGRRTAVVDLTTPRSVTGKQRL